MPTETEAPFQLRSLLGSNGTASNGEKLVQTLDYHYPPALRAATLRRENEDLALSDTEVEQAAKIAGVDSSDPEIEFAATVRGGHSRAADAWVTYAYYDEDGDLWKGAFPYGDLGQDSSDGHVSQAESLAGSPAAADFADAQEKRRNAPDDVKALQARIAKLEAQSSDEGDADDPAPVKDYGKATARDIATMLSQAPRDTAARVHEYETAHENRSTVVQAAEKRIQALDDEDAKAAADLKAKDDRIADLEQQLAAATGSQGGGS